MADVSSPLRETFSQFSSTEVYQSPPDTPTDDSTKNPLSFGTVATDTTSASVSVAEEVARAMGLPDPVVQMARAFHTLQHGSDFSDASQLFLAAEDLLQFPEKQYKIGMKLYEAEQARKEKKADGKDLICNAVQDAGSAQGASVFPSAEMQKKAPAEPKSAADKAQLREKVRNLAKENQRLRKRKICFQCKNVDLASSGVTFLPCGHFITCETCSEKCEDCPACGKSIMGTVRTFLS